MDKKHAAIIIILLAAILFVLLVGRIDPVELPNSLIAVAIFILAIVTLPVRHIFCNWVARNRAGKRKKLDDEIEHLRLEILSYPGPALRRENIPPRWFSSKEAAQAFGERWSRGGPDSFWAMAVDINGRPEDHAGFDKTTITWGILRTNPALFFGIREAPDPWRLDFLRTKKRWLKDYRDHLKKGLAP